MALPTIGSLVCAPVLDHPELLAPSTHAALRAWAADEPRVALEIGVVEIDPGLADTAAMTEAYDLPLDVSGNCVLVAGKRGGEERVAAAVVRATTRADVNTTVRRLLDARKASFLAMDRAVEGSGMEYGGITPIGLPTEWRVLLDSSIAADDGAVIVGSGVRRSKVLLPGSLLAALPGVEVVEGLGTAA